ncbi:hypothetical protein SDC9_151611 [bioreactor metagenome]|uniref:Uncharacterized protein n=1 Tax=bioreactor metagenome TaxID=1076179 RepID=A0A645EV67_9ZZZZ
MISVPLDPIFDSRNVRNSSGSMISCSETAYETQKERLHAPAGRNGVRLESIGRKRLRNLPDAPRRISLRGPDDEGFPEPHRVEDRVIPQDIPGIRHGQTQELIGCELNAFCDFRRLPVVFRHVDDETDIDAALRGERKRLQNAVRIPDRRRFGRRNQKSRVGGHRKGQNGPVNPRPGVDDKEVCDSLQITDFFDQKGLPALVEIRHLLDSRASWQNHDVPVDPDKDVLDGLAAGNNARQRILRRNSTYKIHIRHSEVRVEEKHAHSGFAERKGQIDGNVALPDPSLAADDRD